MRCKGQAEVIIIVALFAVIAVVVITQTNMFIVPEETPDVRTVRESAEGLVRTAVISTIGVLSDQGGYLSDSEYQLGSVSLNGRDVPYWQYRGQVTVPDKSSNLQAGIQSYLQANKDSFADALSDVTFGNPIVNVPIFSDDSITVTVTMPTTYKESPISQPYTVTIPTHFGEIYDFSRGFAIYEANSRPFEYYTLSSMLLSPIENGHHSIPMYEFMMGCGDYLFASSWDITPKVETAIKRTLAHTYMPGKAPEGTITTSASPKYTLVPINGKDYENLRVSFMLPDDFSLDYSNFRMSPDPVFGIAEPIPLMGECMSRDAIEVSYTMNYPVIVRVADPETGSVFQYAVDVYIISNMPAGWTVTSPLDQEEDGVCANPSCILELNVLGTSGSPIQGAAVGFMGCHLGTTDSSGYLATLAPCGAGTLYIEKRGYGQFLESRTSAELSGTVTLYRKPQVNIIFHEVVVQDQGSGQYMVYYGGVKPLEDKRAYITLREQRNLKEHSFYPNGPSISISTVPAGDYYVIASLASMDFQSVHGGLVYYYTLEEGTNELHIYIPSTYDFNSIATTEEQLEKISELSQVLEECGIGPVTETSYTQEEACSVTIA